MGKKTNHQRSLDRRAKVEQLRAEQRRADRRRTLLIVGITGVVSLVIIGITAIAVYNAQQNKNEAEAAAASPIDGVQTYEDLGRNHVDGPIDYPQTPPVGGDHAPVWQNCGVYSSPVGDTNVVHSLEHGAVWIAYQPDLAADQVTTLEGMAQGEDHAIVAPYDGLGMPVVAIAWGVQLEVDSADDPRLETFVAKYLQGPQTPEPGATCFGGVGPPQ